jgi:BirA family biotin operon repressor/biotin-[acetyl-CoA-carboxylase] ligase
MIIGSKLLFFEILPSTNTKAAELLKKKTLQEGSVICTKYQSAGKGYSSNTWESEDGKNLLISIVLFPSFIIPSDQFHISMAISLGISDFISRFISGGSVKWPNDIYVNNDKIAGILIENHIKGDQFESTVAGIGLNINQEKFLSSAPNPVSLHQLTGNNYDLALCLELLLEDLDSRYKQLIAGKIGLLKQEYVSKLYRLNEWFEFIDAKGKFTGRILTIGDYGRIIIENKKGEIKEYSFKEIEFVM